MLKKIANKSLIFIIIEGIRALILKTRYIYTCMFKYGKITKAVIYKDPHSTCSHKSIKARSLLIPCYNFDINYFLLSAWLDALVFAGRIAEICIQIKAV